MTVRANITIIHKSDLFLNCLFYFQSWIILRNTVEVNGVPCELVSSSSGGKRWPWIDSLCFDNIILTKSFVS